MALARNLRRLRLRAGLTPGQLAERLGVTHHTIQAWERGERTYARDGASSWPKRSVAPSATCTGSRASRGGRGGSGAALRSKSREK